MKSSAPTRDLLHVRSRRRLGPRTARSSPRASSVAAGCWWRGSRRARLASVGLVALIGLVDLPRASASGDFERSIQALLVERCVKCHRGRRPKGGVDLAAIESAADLRARPELLVELLEVVERVDMPPAGEPAPSAEERSRFVTSARRLLRDAVADAPPPSVPVRRLNRLQYNHCVRDLFGIESDVFRLPEKLMSRHGAYLAEGVRRMPDRVEAECLSLRPEGGLQGVTAFPKDLRAAHGFDNQANQLTLSPLLLEAFLKLGLSIVESPDFHAGTVGRWGELFAEPPAGVDPEAEARRRIEPFLRIAFRGRVDAETIRRYEAFAISKLAAGAPFTATMKRLASAALSSPLFLYRPGSLNETDGSEGADGADALVLASDLSFFLWGSGPDVELLRLAESGELSRPDVLRETVERMLRDPRIERFLDTFPAQWMQLENVLAATPEPARHRLFSLDPSRPASLQMVLEPLLLFDAVFVEDRPVVELIAPTFAYRSELLRRWYAGELEAPRVDEVALAAENRAREERIRELEAARDALRAGIVSVEEGFPALVERELRTFDVDAAQARWEAAQAAAVAESVTLSSWHRIGPFQAGSFDEAYAKEFVDAGSIDLEAQAGELRWTESRELVDGQVHTLSGASCATYLRRTIRSAAARTLEVSIGSDDAFKLWLDGRLVAEKKVTRGVAPDQDRLQLELPGGESALLLKVVNGGGGYGFYFRATPSTLPEPVLAALRVARDDRSAAEREAVRAHFLEVAPELARVRREHAARRAALEEELAVAEAAVAAAPKPRDPARVGEELRRAFDDGVRRQLASRVFERVPADDPRYGGVITTAATMSMTSGPQRTHPIARGAWIIEVIFNDPPPPPPNDVPPLPEDDDTRELTIRERFAKHRESPDCAGCHEKIDPLGFALENFDVTGRWRDEYDNGRAVDASGTLLRRHEFEGVVDFKRAIVAEERRFVRAFTAHLLRFALSRELAPRDWLTVDAILERAEPDDYRLRALIREVVLSESFRRIGFERRD